MFDFPIFKFFFTYAAWTPSCFFMLIIAKPNNIFNIISYMLSCMLSIFYKKLTKRD